MVSGGRPLKGQRVLIVEGDYVLACDLRRLMQEAGAKVLGPAWSEEAGLDLADSEVFDAALLGAKLTHGSADSIATKLAERGVPFVVVTDHDGDILAPALREACYVDTSFHHRNLVAMVANGVTGSITATASPLALERPLTMTRAIPRRRRSADLPKATSRRIGGRPN